MNFSSRAQEKAIREASRAEIEDRTLPGAARPQVAEHGGAGATQELRASRGALPPACATTVRPPAFARLDRLG